MISDLAYCHPNSRLAKNVIIEPFAYISENVERDEGTWIGPHSTILDGARIGKNCRIFPSSVISGIPQDLKFRGEDTTAEIGDGSTVREAATINRGTASAGKTIIGSKPLIMAYAPARND